MECPVGLSMIPRYLIRLLLYYYFIFEVKTPCGKQLNIITSVCSQ